MRWTARDNARAAFGSRTPSPAERRGRVQPNPTRRGRTTAQERRVAEGEGAVARSREQKSAKAAREWSRGLADYRQAFHGARTR